MNSDFSRLRPIFFRAARLPIWFALYRNLFRSIDPGNTQRALDAYVRLHTSFVLIHPFFDGNGRLARLVSNLPVLSAGLPPIIIPREERKAYIEILSTYHYVAGQIRAGGDLTPHLEELDPFSTFCRKAWRASIALVEEAQKKQQAR